MKIATAFVELRADRSGANKDLDAFEGDVKKKSDSIAKQFAQVFGAAAFAAGIKKSIDAASNLNETISKTDQLFGADADAVVKFGTTTAKSMGLSQRAYLDAASSLKGLLDNLGLAPEMATGWSQKLTQLGSDLGSFFNKDPAEAVEAIGSALRGEAEPIRAFNVQINEAAIKQQALTMGLYDGVGAIDSNAKAQATLQLIMDQTSAAQGDFARTSDGAANSQRIAKAAAEDSAASLGQAFLPIYTRVVQVVTALAEGFGGLSAPIQTAIVALVGLVALNGPIGKVMDVAKSVTSAFGKMTTSGKIGFGLLGAAAGLALFGIERNLAEVEATNAFNRARIDDFTAALRDGATAAEAWDKALTEGGTVEFTRGTGGVEDLVPILVRAGLTFEEFKGHLSGSKEEFEAWARSIDTAGDPASKMKLRDLNGLLNAGTQLMDQMASATQQRAEQAKAHGTVLDGERHGLDQLRGSTDNAKQAADKLAAATQEEAKKSDVFAESLRKQRDLLDEMYPKEYDAVKAKYEYADAQSEAMIAVDALNTVAAANEKIIDKGNARLAAGKPVSEAYTKATEDVASASETAKDAIMRQSEQYATLDGAASGSQGAIARQITSLEAQRDALAPGSPLRAYLDQYITDLKNIPSNVSTILDLHIVSDATNKNAPGYLPRYGGAGASGIKTKLGEYYEVAEGGRPEVYEQDGRMYLLPSADGKVTPWGAAGGQSQGNAGRSGGVTFTGDFYNEVDVDAAFRLANFYMAGSSS